MDQKSNLVVEALVVAYLNIINNAISYHRGRDPYRSLVETSERGRDARRIEMYVHDDGDDGAVESFFVRFAQGSLELERHGSGAAQRRWDVGREHLEEVVRDPLRYIEDPDELKIELLTSLSPDSIYTN